VGGLPLVKALRDWMRCQDKDISESSLGFCGNLTIGSPYYPYHTCTTTDDT